MTENTTPPVPQRAAQAVEGGLAERVAEARQTLANNQWVAEAGLVFRRPEAAVNVDEMIEGIRQVIAPHMGQFIGQPNTTETQGRIRETLGAFGNAAAEHGGVAATFAEALRNNDIQAVDRAIRGATDERLGVDINDLVTANTVSHRYTSSTDQLKKYSKTKLSEEDERFHLAFKKGRKAFEDMDYLKSHEALGEFLEITGGSRDGQFRSEEGRLPNYVPIQTVREMVGHFMSSMETLIQLRNSLKEFEKFHTKNLKRGEVNPSSELYHHVDSRVCDMIDGVRWACEKELGPISKEGVPYPKDMGVAEDSKVDEFEDIDDSPEELTEAQRLILEIDRIATLQREQEQMGWQVHTGRGDELTAAVAPPLTAALHRAVGEGMAPNQVLTATNVWVDTGAVQGEGPTEIEF